MKNISLSFATVLLVLGTHVFGAAPTRDWRAIADSAQHNHPYGVNSNTNALWSLMQYKGPYELLLTKGKDGGLIVEARRDEVLCHRWSIGTHGTPFLIKDNVLYYPIVPGGTTGCTIVALDLDAKKELWRTALEAMGFIDHSKYTNFGVSLRFEQEALRIDGRETAGRYIEFLDLRTGKTLANRQIGP